MAAQLSELSAAASVLNAQSENINSKIRELSTKLDEMDIGIEVWLAGGNYLEDGDWFNVDRDEDSEAPINGQVIRYCAVEQLGFAKVEEKWQLSVRSITLEEYIEWNGTEAQRLVDPSRVRPLLKAGRNLRIASLGLMDPLTDEILRRMKAAIAKVSPPPKDLPGAEVFKRK